MRESQDFQSFAANYRERFPDDILDLPAPLADGQDVAAIVEALALQGRAPMLACASVPGSDWPLVTNVFASRQRIARLFGVGVEDLHAEYQRRANAPVDPVFVNDGAVAEVVTEGEAVDLSALPMIRHFDSDRGPYVTNAIIVASDPETGIANLSYHRSMRHAQSALATSLHSRGHLWRMYQTAREAGRPLPVAMIIGAHPLFMLAASARVAFGTDERAVAGGLMQAPLEMIATPRHGIGVPANAEFVLEGHLDPEAHVAEGPFGEFSGYSSDRSTNTLFHVTAMMRKRAPWLVDVVGGATDEHLNLARLPREAEMLEKLKARFPSVTGLHYPTSGTHFHCYVRIRQTRPGEARQVMLGLLGWDPYLKTVIAVDDDIDVTQDSQVLWALATHFQPHRDMFTVDGLPGSPLDPSSTADGTTSRLALDATRGPDFHGIRAVLDAGARDRAQALLRGLAGARP
ncbi:UbiD family decarboxylase [Paracoccus sp. CPCC 101403]|uniref:UbiD family decarboxylase n=1 Tax=Paracoccus broussonetiae TaxID=3075834 RepID=A0ABU3EEH4_9RHOB|nr:UbiD family decarboxylase [Paracoccus sp. CPCC 101403]MDT1062526.1 UbiD family decarboxylase [Paracoccus sp. CPCC 101403]